jgi:tetratricopeptide (TPR) repeat protein
VVYTSVKLAIALPALLLCVPAGAQTPGASDALALQQQGRLGEAEQAWRVVVQRNPQDAAAQASLGVVLSREGKYAEAIPTYKQALALNPSLPGVQLNLGLAEFKQGKFQAAIPPLRAALAADPQNMQARTLLGLSCYAAKRFADAVEYLQPAAKADPGNIELRQTLAQSCLLAKKYDCAQDEFRQILLQSPDSPSAHMLLGEALDGLGRTAEAISEFEAAAEAGPREPEVHFGLGYLYWKSHNFDGAEKAFQDELSIDPNHAQSLAYLGDIESKRSDPEKALPLLEKAVQIRSDVRIAYVDLGALLMQQKKYQQAMAALQHAVKLDPAKPDAHFRLGRLYQAIGKNAEAQQEFAKVRQLNEKENEDIASKMAAPRAAVPQ